MRITSFITGACATLATLAACGSSAPPAAADPRCDAYAEPGRNAVQTLADGLGAGETGCLRGGDYVGTGKDGYVLVPGHGGRRGAPITIRSAPGERARLRGVIYTPPGSGHFRLSHLSIDARHPTRPARGQIGIQVLADDISVAHSRITTRRAKTCLIITDGAKRTRVSDSVFHDCGDPGNRLFDHAIYAASSVEARIVDNVFVRASGWAVHLYPGARRSFVARNVMWDNGGAVIFAGDGDYASNHNIVVDNVMGGSKQRPELTSSFGGPLGRGNLARGNCLVPGLLASEGEGYRAVANRVASPSQCLAELTEPVLARLGRVAPALAARR